MDATTDKEIDTYCGNCGEKFLNYRPKINYISVTYMKRVDKEIEQLRNKNIKLENKVVTLTKRVKKLEDLDRKQRDFNDMFMKRISHEGRK